MINSISDLRKEVRKLGEKISAPFSLLCIAGGPTNNGGPHIKIKDEKCDLNIVVSLWIRACQEPKLILKHAKYILCRNKISGSKHRDQVLRFAF